MQTRTNRGRDRREQKIAQESEVSELNKFIYFNGLSVFRAGEFLVSVRKSVPPAPDRLRTAQKTPTLVVGERILRRRKRIN